MAPEDRLILVLCWGRLTPELVAEAHELLAGPLAWDRIVDCAIEQKVLPPFRRNLERLGFPGVPADARERMNKLCRANAAP